MAPETGSNSAIHNFSNVANLLHWLRSIPNAFMVEIFAQKGTDSRDVLTMWKIVARDGYLGNPKSRTRGLT